MLQTSDLRREQQRWVAQNLLARGVDFRRFAEERAGADIAELFKHAERASDTEISQTMQALLRQMTSLEGLYNERLHSPHAAPLRLVCNRRSRGEVSHCDLNELEKNILYSIRLTHGQREGTERAGIVVAASHGTEILHGIEAALSAAEVRYQILDAEERAAEIPCLGEIGELLRQSLEERCVDGTPVLLNEHFRFGESFWCTTTEKSNLEFGYRVSFGMFDGASFRYSPEEQGEPPLSFMIPERGGGDERLTLFPSIRQLEVIRSRVHFLSQWAMGLYQRL